MDGIFGHLNNVVWTNYGPCAVSDFQMVRGRLASRGPVVVYSVDKFPRMVDYVVPSGVRIGDADRVRLGAHLAEGTTVMHEGFVNFNAGTLGASMVEGRISAGVVVGDGSDIGGGASIMGTLSGGGKEIISIGERCLLGANSGIGISLGDDAVVEAGLYVTAGTKVTVFGKVAEALGVGNGENVKGSQLSGASGMLLRRNSVSGAVEAVEWKSEAVALNDELHKINTPIPIDQSGKIRWRVTDNSSTLGSGLKVRHLTMMGLGSTIGAGLSWAPASAFPPPAPPCSSPTSSLAFWPFW